MEETHNIANEYTAIDAVSVSYDYAGNLSEDPNGYEYEYDHDNRLTKVTKPGPTTVAEYSYDALGRRVEFTDVAGGWTHRYYYDGWRVLTETVDDGDETRRDYTYGNYLDEVLADAGNGSSVAVRWYLHDHLFSSVALANSAGIMYRFEYDAYGKQYCYNADFSSLLSGAPTSIAFTGQRLDWLNSGDLMVMYYKNRYYSFVTGRFLQRDPLGVRDHLGITEFSVSGQPLFLRAFTLQQQYHIGPNIYEYAIGSPLVATDPFGLFNQTMADIARSGKCGVCGPEIGHMLHALRDATRRFFQGLSDDAERERWCEARFDRAGWDILELKPELYPNHKDDWPEGCATGDCSETVSVFGKCQSKNEVNYFFWGVTRDLCSDYGDGAKEKAGAWIYTNRYFYQEANSPGGKRAWAAAGMAGSARDVNNRGSDFSFCKPCPSNKSFPKLTGAWRNPNGVEAENIDWDKHPPPAPISPYHPTDPYWVE